VVSSLGKVLGPIQQFFRLEAASGILLFGAAIVALVWANSPVRDSYQALFATPLVMRIAGGVVRVSVRQVINEPLMTVFFFVVGMEIKRELVAGELRTMRRAILPAIAALGGMIVPSAIFIAVNAGGAGQAGWGIPMATDIAFAIGCLTLLRRWVPQSLVVFVTALAIFDDVGGILVIALFYGHGLHPWWLGAGAGVTLVLILMGRGYVRSGLAYAALGGVLWYALFRSGIHATIAGVILGLTIPARPDVDDLESPLARFIHACHPWVAFAIMPLFALANSGVTFRGKSADELTGSVAAGVALGLALGKPLGITAATALAVRSGIADRPGEAGWLRIVGVSTVAGIGFTVALFIADLAYPEAAALLDQAKIGILGGSLLAGIGGVLLIRAAGPPPAAAD
jgi:NhaA family Na+:H+ antiporter